MKIIITNKATFSSKKGDEYVKAQFINPETGATGELFTSKKEFDGFNVEIADTTANPEVVNALRGIQTHDVEFDQKGRLVSIK